MSRTDDLHPAQVPAIDLSSGKLVGSLTEFSQFIENENERALQWYFQKRQSKRWLGRTLRLGAIIATGFAAILPVLTELFPGTNGKPRIAPLWATVAIALAGSLVLVDRFLGCTSGWIRYMKAAVQLSQLLLEYRLDKVALQSTWKEEPTDLQVAKYLETARAFAMRSSSVVADETNAWISEFQAALQLVDESAKTAVEARKLGAMRLVVANGAEFQEGWSVSIDGGPTESVKGAMKVFLGMMPGLHAIEIKGHIGTKELRAEAVATVNGGAVTEVQATLA